MKQSVIIIFLIVCNYFSFSQPFEYEYRCYSVFSKLMDEKKYEEASFKINACEDSVGKNHFIYYLKGRLFYEKGDYLNAEKSILKAIDTFGPRAFDFYYLALTDVYIKMKDYKKAFTALQANDSINSYTELFSAFRKQSNINYRKAECYEEVGQVDTAIAILTPYMFTDIRGYIKESKEISKYYLNLLLRKYSLSEIKKELKHSLKNVIFNSNLKKERNKFSVPKYTYSCETTSYMHFWGIKILLMKMTTVQFNNDDIIFKCLEKYTKKSVVQRIKNSYLYKEIYLIK